MLPQSGVVAEVLRLHAPDDPLGVSHEVINGGSEEDAAAIVAQADLLIEEFFADLAFQRRGALVDFLAVQALGERQC